MSAISHTPEATAADQPAPGMWAARVPDLTAAAPRTSPAAGGVPRRLTRDPAGLNLRPPLYPRGRLPETAGRRVGALGHRILPDPRRLPPHTAVHDATRTGAPFTGTGSPRCRGTTTVDTPHS